jgi:hypothetical protein
VVATLGRAGGGRRPRTGSERACTERSSTAAFTIITPLPYHLPSSGEPWVETPVPHSPSSAVVAERRQARAVGGRAPVGTPPCSWPHRRGPPWTEAGRSPRPVDRVHDFLLFSHKNSPKISKFHIFSTTTPNLVILAAKFSGSFRLSFYAFI